MIARRMNGPALAVLALVAAAGCAPMTSGTAKPTSAAPPPASSTSAGAPAHESTPVPAPTAAGMDTTMPSADAQRVLARIPEPLTPAQQALNPSQDTTAARGRAVAPAAAYDSLQAAPVPAATQPLGTETSTVTMGDAPAASAASPAGTAVAPSAASAGGAATGAAAPASAGAAAAAGGAAAGAAAASTPAASATSAAAPSASGNGEKAPCWRLQVGAPLESEKDKADARLEAAQSLLVTNFTIVPEKGYLKIRTSDCMSRDVADALKKRAVESGFNDAFLLDTNAAPPPPSTTKHQRVPASKHKQ
jgi:hypothetical protein